MPTDPLQFILAGLEISLLIGGVGVLIYLLSSADRRRRWIGTNQLTDWPITLAEFFLYVLLMLILGSLCQLVLQAAFGTIINHATDSDGLGVLVYGAGFHGGSLLGLWLFPHLRTLCYGNYGSLPPPINSVATTTLPWTRCFLYAGATLLLLMPVLGASSLVWTALLRHFGLPDEPQDLLAIFQNTQSSLVITGMLLVACVIAPLNEELLFRAGIYRYCRQKLGRRWGFVICGSLFGVMHGNLAGFLPLAILGAVLALAYEVTGSIRVVVITHALFNLNTILILFSGLPTT